LKGFAASLSMGASAEPQPEVPSKNPPNPRTPARAGSAATGASPKGDNEVRTGTSRATHTESLEVVGVKGSRSVDLAVEPMSLVPRSFVTLGLSRAPEIAGFTKAGVPVFREPEPLIVIASTDEEDGPTGATGRIYSREDGEVTPPKSVYPRLPADSEVGLRTRGRTILEVVVSTQGLVERVALRSAPQNIHEFMLVSAAKAWQFEPATVEGRPVRFRHLISLTTPEKVAWVRRAR
jgi:outer membrane biosynthesis protein TonB